jgi:DNA-binding HxlR family transcriptional regulator
MKKSKSVSQQIVSVLKKSGTLRLADIRIALPDIKTNYISSSLWNLKKAGTVNHNIDSGEYTLTSVNKTQEQAAPKEKPSHSEAVKEGMAKTISKLNMQIADYKKTLDRADTVYEELSNRYKVLQSTHSQVQEVHVDALAVIRYLENKLYVVIKTNRA